MSRDMMNKPNEKRWTSYLSDQNDWIGPQVDLRGILVQSFDVLRVQEGTQQVLSLKHRQIFKIGGTVPS
jgi:hypothetical protein